MGADIRCPTGKVRFLYCWDAIEGRNNMISPDFYRIDSVLSKIQVYPLLCKIGQSKWVCMYTFPVDSPIDVSCMFIVKYLWAHHTNSARNLGSNIQMPEVMRYISVKLLLLSFFIYLLDTHKYFLLRDTCSFIHSTNQIIYFLCRCVLFSLLDIYSIGDLVAIVIFHSDCCLFIILVVFFV